MISINKYISSSGYCSRRQADSLVRAGKVFLNGKAAKPTDKVTENDIVKINSKTIEPSKHKIYLAFNKPVGVICTTDKEAKNNIMEYIKVAERVFPIGRLDVKSSGLILLTNDGDFAQKVTKSKKVEKEYLVEVNKTINKDFISKIQKPFFIDGFPTLPAKVKKNSNKNFSVIIKEGRKRQIRRMCEKLKYEVKVLKRIRIGNVSLANLKEKEYRLLTKEEINNLE